MDVWTDPNLRPFMAVTAHFIKDNGVSLQLCTELVGFRHLPGRHTGEHLARVFIHILDRLDITGRVCDVSIISCWTID